MLSCRQKQLEQSEGRASAQRGELSAVRETHQKGEVERQLLEEERAQLKEALVRVNKTSLVLYFLWNALKLCAELCGKCAPSGGEQNCRALITLE